MEDRHKKIVNASLAGILINFVFVVVKGLIGALSGSISVLVDAVNNMTDVLSSVVTLLGVKLARKKPDKEHPHGHGRVEYIAAITVGIIILMVGISAIVASAPKISNPEIADYSLPAVIVIFITVIIKLVFGKYLRKLGKSTKSRSLEGTGIDAMFDALLTAGTLVGVGVSMVFKISIDGIIGVVIAAFIVKSAVNLIREGLTDLIGRRADEGITRRVREIIKASDKVEGVLKLVLYDYGPEDVSGAAQIEVKQTMSVDELKTLASEIEEKILNELGVKLIIGV